MTVSFLLHHMQKNRVKSNQIFIDCEADLGYYFLRVRMWREPVWKLKNTRIV